VTKLLTAALAVSFAAAAFAYDATPLGGGLMVVVTAAALRAEPGPDEAVVAPLKAGEEVRVWASTYVTVREETLEGGERFVTEHFELWYRVKTADGFEGWVTAAALDWPPERKTTP
jgi:uncharacterized protein YgiM (DUF1202 family)